MFASWRWWWSSCCCGDELEQQDELNEHLLAIQPSAMETSIWQCPPALEAFLHVDDIINLSRTSKTLREYCFQVLLKHKRVLVNEPLSVLRVCPKVRSLRFHYPFIADELNLYFLHATNRVIALTLDNVYWQQPLNHPPLVLEQVCLYNMRNLIHLNWIFPQELQVFQIQRCPLVEFYTIQSFLQHCSSALRVLHLKSQQLGGIHNNDTMCWWLSQLREVDISSSRNVHDIVQLIVRNCPNLLVLDANYTDLYDDDLLALRECCVELQRLTLNSCIHLTDAALMHVPSTITCLNLAQTEVTDVGLCDLQCYTLQQLFLSNCIHITDIGLFALMRRNASTLHELAISHCRNIQMMEEEVVCIELRTLRCLGLDKDIISRFIQANPKLTRVFAGG